MAIDLVKGSRLNLTKDTGIKEAMVGLGWAINAFDGEDYDLDLVLFQLDANGRNVDDNHFIFYHNLCDPEGAVKHSGDNLTGGSDGDDEMAVINFTKISPQVQKIVVVVSIYEAKSRRQNFGMVDDSYIRMVDTKNGKEILRYSLAEKFDVQTSVVFAEIYRKDKEWYFKAVGQGFAKELAELCGVYGIDVAHS